MGASVSVLGGWYYAQRSAATRGHTTTRKSPQSCPILDIGNSAEAGSGRVRTVHEFPCSCRRYSLLAAEKSLLRCAGSLRRRRASPFHRRGKTARPRRAGPPGQKNSLPAGNSLPSATRTRDSGALPAAMRRAMVAPSLRRRIPMIHHVSIPAREPQHVAAVLAELMGGKCFPFGPLEGAFMAASGDEHGTMIEVYPERPPSIFRPVTTRSCSEHRPLRAPGRSMCCCRCR